MTTAIIILLCTLVLIAYLFDISSAYSKIPSVILLLVFGWTLKQATFYFQMDIPDVSVALPILGTVGLILIVLEGSMELTLNQSKLGLIKQSFITATVPMLVLAAGSAYLLTYFGQPNLRLNLINIIPLCVISSAIAIPSVRGLSELNREFIIYESSLSDILGVLIFNFVALNHTFGMGTFGVFFLQMIAIVVVSVITIVFLAFFLSRTKHHVKFVPIILMVVLFYGVSKVYHLPGLVFILFFGLFLSNIEQLSSISWIKKLHPNVLSEEVKKLHALTGEGAFLIRSLFFILFGYMISTADILNTDTLVWAVGLSLTIFSLRALQLWLAKLPIMPLLFIAPRGLITILLFLSISAEEHIALVNNSLIVQVIAITAFVMMLGLMFHQPTVQGSGSQNH